MNGAVNFLLESGISLSLLATVYIVFLKKETFFRLNRVFLLGSLLFSVVLPLIKFRIYDPQPIMLSEIVITPYRNVLEAVTIYGQDFSISVEKAVLSISMLIWMYFAGVVFFLGRYIVRVVQVAYIIRSNKVRKYNGIKVVLLEKECSPYSFLNYVFISRSLQNSEGYDRMLAHEMEHVKQGHSFDVLILELLAAFQWFNPFLWMLRRAVRENHEYLADKAVLDSGVNRGYYKQLLLNQYAGGQLVIANHFNYSLIKKRIKMMSKIKSSKTATIKFTFGVLMAVALVVFFACEQKETVEPISSQEEPVTIKSTILDDGRIKIEGTAENLEKYKNMFSGNRDFALVTDDKGDLFLVKKKTEQDKHSVGEEEVFFIVEQMPEFQGGEQALRQFIANNIVYPETAQKNGVQGKVFISFIVDKDGNIADAKIARGVDPALDQEALRVVNSLPAWKPGFQKGKPVNVSYTVPINFALQ